MKTVDFMGYGRASSIFSTIMVLLSLGIIFSLGIKKSVDFEGGSKLTVAFQDRFAIGVLRDQVTPIEAGAAIVTIKTEEGAGSEFSLKIKNDKLGETKSAGSGEQTSGSDSDISPERRQNLEQAFGVVSGDQGTLDLLKAASVESLTVKMMTENILSINADETVKTSVYTDLAQQLKAHTDSATSVRALANAVDAENGADLALGLSICYPAINRVTVDQLNAILTRYNPLGRSTGTPYAEIAKQITDARTAKGEFFSDYGFLTGLTLGEGESADALASFIKGNFSLGKYRISSIENFSASIASELLGKAWEAVVLAILGILAYIALRFSVGYGMAAVIALVHDVTIALGVFALFGAELSNPVVAAFLTIVGYSLNDTIVVFDRIRETLGHRKSGDVKHLMNVAINDTLSRTVVTSMTTLFVVVVINLFSGNATLETFSFPLLVGITVGTYSSIFVASPVLLWWHYKVKPIT